MVALITYISRKSPFSVILIPILAFVFINLVQKANSLMWMRIGIGMEEGTAVISGLDGPCKKRKR